MPFQAIAIILLLLAFDVHAAVYKCKDAQGKVHYQDRACSGDKQAARFNSSAGNITSSDSAATYRQSDALDRLAAERKASRPQYNPDDDHAARGNYIRDRDRLDSALARTKEGSLKSGGGRTFGRGGEDRAMLERQRRNLEAAEIARKNGTQYIPEQPPARTVIRESSRSNAPATGSERIYNPRGNNWCWNHGNGAPLQCD